MEFGGWYVHLQLTWRQAYKASVVSWGFWDFLLGYYFCPKADVKSEGFSVMTALDAFVVGWQALHLSFSLFQGGGASKGSFLPGRGALHEGHGGPSVGIWMGEMKELYPGEKNVMAYHYLQ